jgi:hypothetical protein
MPVHEWADRQNAAAVHLHDAVQMYSIVVREFGLSAATAAGGWGAHADIIVPR